MKTSLQAVTLWSRKAPSHNITAIILTDDQRTVVTGSLEGQICLWNLSPEFQISSRAILCGHTAPVTLLSKARNFEKQPYVLSCAENGELCVWDVASGRCVESTTLQFRHTSICYYHCTFRMTGDGWLLCSGEYRDVLIIDASTLQVLHVLKSQNSEWISDMCIVHSTRIQEDSLVAVSVVGDLKVWDLSSSVNIIQEKKTVYETESKSLDLKNCVAVRFCSFTERFLLVICSDSWKVYDYCDFSLLCSERCINGQPFSGGEFLAANRLIIWTQDCHSYIYQLLNSGLSKSVSPADGGILKETISPHLLCSTDMKEHERFSCVMGFMNERKEPFYKILYSGGTYGRISFWHIPDVPVSKFDGSPKEIPIATTLTLQESFDKHGCMSEGIIDHLCAFEDGSANAEVTASLYIPNLDKLVCGCKDGKIFVCPALHAARARLLKEHSMLKGSLPHRILGGHSRSVTCLLYPHIKSDKFDKSWLVSAGQDSLVIWWDVFTGEMLHTFALQAGPVVQLLLPAGEYTSSICSIYSDHSVALLHLQDRTCLLHARKHLFPVKIIKFHPIEDLLIVGCEDDSAYVWDIETGTLERHETGELAKAILAACIESHFQKPDPAPSLTQETQKKNSIYKSASSHKLGALSHSLPHTEKCMPKLANAKNDQNPFSFLPVETKWNNIDFHVILFDIEKLLELLLSSQASLMKAANSFHSYETLKTFKSSVEKRTLTLKRNKTANSLYQPEIPTKTTSMQSSVKENRLLLPGEDSSSSKRHKKMKSSKKHRSHPEGDVDVNVITDVAKLLLSCFLPWGTDEELDDLSIRYLDILQLQNPVSFGLLSKEDHLSLMLPGWNHTASELAAAQSPGNLFSPKVLDLSNKYLNTVQSHSEATRAPENTSVACGPETMFYFLSRMLLANRTIKMPSLSKTTNKDSSHHKLESIRSKWKNLETFNTSFPVGDSSHEKTPSNFPDADNVSMVKLFSCWRDQPVQAVEAIQAVLLAEVRRHMETLRKPPTETQPVAIAQTEISEKEALANSEEKEEELQSVAIIPVQTPVSVAKKDSSLKAENRQETGDRPDGCIIEDSESPADDLKQNPWISKVCYCKVC